MDSTHFSKNPNNNLASHNPMKPNNQISTFSSEPNKTLQSDEDQTKVLHRSCLNHMDLPKNVVLEPEAVMPRDHFGREKLKKHRVEVAGRVLIPDTWDQEKLLKDWIDYSSFDKLLAPNGIGSAREALVAEGRREKSRGLRIESRC